MWKQIYTPIAGPAVLRLGTWAAALVILLVASSQAKAEDAYVMERTDLVDELYQATKIKLSLYSSDLEGYTDGLPFELAAAERNMGQVRSEYDQQPPMIWFKVSFDAKNSLRSKLASVFK